MNTSKDSSEKIVRIDSTGSTFEYLEELTRCKDCKHFQAHRGRYQTWRIVSTDGVCKLHRYEMVKAEDYCSFAERKEEK